MSEDIQTQEATLESSPGVEGQDQTPETPSQDSNLPEQSDNQNQQDSPGKVEPEQPIKTSRPENRRASEFVKQRLEIKELKNKLRELESKSISNTPPAPEKPSLREYNDEEIYQKGLGKSFAELRQEIIDQLEKKYEEKFSSQYEKYQAAKKEASDRQELNNRISKLKEDGKWELFQEVVEKNPEIDFYANKDTFKAFEMAVAKMEEIERTKNPNTPLAGKKSRMGIAGSGTPMNGGSGKPSLEVLLKEKEKLQDMMASNFNNPDFIKKWDENTAALASLAK